MQRLRVLGTCFYVRPLLVGRLSVALTLLTARRPAGVADVIEARAVW